MQVRHIDIVNALFKVQHLTKRPNRVLSKVKSKIMIWIERI